LRRERIEAIRIVDMTESNSWAEFAALFRNTREGRKVHGPAPAQHVGHGTMRLPDRSGSALAPTARFDCVQCLRPILLAVIPQPERIEAFRQNPPADWNGVYEAESK
jgi:hypothetical protein